MTSEDTELLCFQLWLEAQGLGVLCGLSARTLAPRHAEWQKDCIQAGVNYQHLQEQFTVPYVPRGGYHIFGHAPGETVNITYELGEWIEAAGPYNEGQKGTILAIDGRGRALIRTKTGRMTGVSLCHALPLTEKFYEPGGQEEQPVV